MDTFHDSHPHTAPSSATADDPPKVLDALCAVYDHQLDSLPDLLDVFAGKRVVNKELTGQLYCTGNELPPVSFPFAHALDTSDPTDRALAFAITGRVRNLIQGMNEGDSPIRSRRSSATSTRSRHGSVGGFSPIFTSSPRSLNADTNADRGDEDAQTV
jgi:hypothetical protein